MSITKRNFGVLLNGEKVSCYTMENINGMKAEVLDYGCIIKNLYINDKNNSYVDVVLGFDTLAEYGDNKEYFGALIGRNSNRIADAKLRIGKRTYRLGKNDGANNLNGGFNGFDKKLWKVKIINDLAEPTLLMTLNSYDGEEGFPGDLDVMVTYTLTKDNGFKIHYTAVASKDTVVNLTNHSYFNLNGHSSGKSICNLELCLSSDFFLPNNEACMPNGEILSVKNTPFDFTSPKAIGKAIGDESFSQLKMFGGYNHNFVIKGSGLRSAGSLLCPDNGIFMELFTDSPGLHVYSANTIEEGRSYKEKASYRKHYGICLAPQYLPGAFSYSHFKAPLLKKGEKYDSVTEYRFSIK